MFSRKVINANHGRVHWLLQSGYYRTRIGNDSLAVYFETKLIRTKHFLFRYSLREIENYHKTLRPVEKCNAVTVKRAGYLILDRNLRYPLIIATYIRAMAE